VFGCGKKSFITFQTFFSSFYENYEKPIFCRKLFQQPLKQGTLKGKYHCTVDLLFDWFGISCMTTDNFCFHLQNRLIKTGQTGGQQYSDTSPFSVPCLKPFVRNFQQFFNGTCCKLDPSSVSRDIRLNLISINLFYGRN